jgi:hypothetical protein
MEDFTRDFTKEHLHLLPSDERLEGLPINERLEGFSIDEITAYLENLKNQQKPAN